MLKVELMFSNYLYKKIEFPDHYLFEYYNIKYPDVAHNLFCWNLSGKHSKDWMIKGSSPAFMNHGRKSRST
jgi:hypothetical protein